MEDMIKKVQEFHRTFGLDMTQSCKFNPNCWRLREKLLAEELGEYYEACEVNNKVQIADAIGDQLYILIGTVISHGLEDKIIDIFNEIHRSNMSKLGEDGKPIYREDGKVVKGPNYSKPNLKEILCQT